MLRHYLIVALRTLRRSPLVALLNIFTLSLGLIAFIGAYSVVAFWERAEQHFPNASRTLLTRVPPLAALRLGYARGGPRKLATLLVGVQFTAAAFLLIAVTVVQLQNQRLERTGLGLSADPLLVIENFTEITGIEQSTLRAELARLPEVRLTTSLESPPWTVQSGTMPLLSSPTKPQSSERRCCTSSERALFGRSRFLSSQDACSIRHAPTTCRPSRRRSALSTS